MKKIILTGGTSHRFGSNKSEAEINGRSLLDILTSELDDLIIVGPKTNIDAIYALENRSLKELVANLKINQVPLVETEFLLDIDTQADLFKAIDLASRLAQ